MKDLPNILTQLNRQLVRQSFRVIADRLRLVPNVVINDEELNKPEEDWATSLSKNGYAQNLLTYNGVYLDLSIDRNQGKIWIKFPVFPASKYSLRGAYNYATRTYEPGTVTAVWYNGRRRLVAGINLHATTLDMVDRRLASILKKHLKLQASQQVARQQSEVRLAEVLACVAAGVRVDQYSGHKLTAIVPVPATATR